MNLLLPSLHSPHAVPHRVAVLVVRSSCALSRSGSSEDAMADWGRAARGGEGEEGHG
jgi:hypothetical protein